MRVSCSFCVFVTERCSGGAKARFSCSVCVGACRDQGLDDSCWLGMGVGGLGCTFITDIAARLDHPKLSFHPV